MRRKFTDREGTQRVNHHGRQRESVSGRAEPTPGILRLGLGARTGPVRRDRPVRRLVPLQPGDPQRALHGVVAPLRLGAAQEEERRLSQVRLRHGEQDVVPDVPVRAVQLREPEHRPDSDPPV